MIEGAGAIDSGLGSKAKLASCFTVVACVGKPRGCRVLSRVCLSIFQLVASYYSRLA